MIEKKKVNRGQELKTKYVIPVQMLKSTQGIYSEYLSSKDVTFHTRRRIDARIPVSAVPEVFQFNFWIIIWIPWFSVAGSFWDNASSRFNEHFHPVRGRWRSLLIRKCRRLASHIHFRLASLSERASFTAIFIWRYVLAMVRRAGLMLLDVRSMDPVCFRCRLIASAK